MRKFFPLFLALFLFCCGGDNFDASSVPPDQLAAEMSFRRVKDHGALEPVLEPQQLVDGWQFYVDGYQKSSALGQQQSDVYILRDRAGIIYRVNTSQNPKMDEILNVGTYGFGRGRIEEVNRDLVKGKISAHLLLSDWQERPE